jgi:hypothetical protein
MARPRKVKVFNHDYKIKTANKASVGVAEAWGWIDFDAFTIYIKPGTPKTVEREVVLHEIIHAINVAVQVEDTKEQDEAIATRLTAGLFTVFRHNKKLTRWLFKDFLIL